MDLKQILIFGMFFLVPVSLHCLGGDRLRESAGRILGIELSDAVETETAVEAPVCPEDLYQRYAPKNLSDRSLSPWRYVLRAKPDHFPSTYYEAQCLCRGCLLFGDGPDGEKGFVHNEDFNSVGITQTKLFLKKERCVNGENEETYHLRPVYFKVAVGCTCARPRM